MIRLGGDSKVIQGDQLCLSYSTDEIWDNSPCAILLAPARR